jgi:peptidoglycan DL-endopeptidase LytF
MKRKDIIIASVLVNAGLLAVLFIFAISSKEPTSVDVAKVMQEKIQLENKPSYIPDLEKEASLHVAQTVLPIEETTESFEVLAPVAEIEKKEEIIHKLPSIAKEEAVKEEKPKSSIVKQNMMEVIVKRGDSLEKLAHRYKTTVANIRKSNAISGSFLKEGQRLIVPKVEIAKAPKKQVVEKNNIEAQYYTVKVGDNPWTIAMKNHLRVDDLLKLNNLNNEKARKLRPGDKLRIR